MRNIKIKAVLNGYIVRVGCQTVVFISLASLHAALEEYLGAEDPAQVERDWLEHSLNSGKLLQVPVIRDTDTIRGSTLYEDLVRAAMNPPAPPSFDGPPPGGLSPEDVRRVT